MVVVHPSDQCRIVVVEDKVVDTAAAADIAVVVGVVRHFVLVLVVVAKQKVAPMSIFQSIDDSNMFVLLRHVQSILVIMDNLKLNQDEQMQ